MKRRALHRAFSALAFAALSILLALNMTGCKESDTIVEDIYDQSSPNVDYDNPDKVYIPDKTSSVTVKDLDLTLDDVSNKDELEKDLPEEKGDPNTQQKAKSHKYNPSMKGLGKAPTAELGEGETRPDLPEEEDLGDIDIDNGQGEGDGGAQEGGGEGDPSGEEGDQGGKYSADMSNDDYQSRTYDSSLGRTSNLPDNIGSVAACGELATAVLVFGDEGSLTGASEDYLDSSSIKKVFEQKDVAKAKAVWSGSGNETSDKDVDDIIDLAPDAVLVFSGQLSAKQERTIAQNAPNTVVITLPRPTSDGNIRTIAKAVGQIFKQDTSGGSVQLANEYASFVDDALDTAKSAHGGGVVTYNGWDFNSTDTTTIPTTSDVSSNQLWTLYISDWDADAQVTATYDANTLFTDTGAAYTKVGWYWSPLSYYMSAGGVINNAAAYGPLGTAEVQPVLCYNQNQVSYTWTNFAVNVDESQGGGSYSRYRAFYVLTNGRDGVDLGGTNPANVHPLGSDDFNTVIVKDASIKSALQEARKNPCGLYSMYEYVKTVSGSGYGRKYSGKNGESIIYSTVRGDTGYKILVNPCGYVGSWTEGSLEAPLESLWIANQYWGLSSSKLQGYIKSFYEKFYCGYEPDVDKILEGDYAE